MLRIFKCLRTQLKTKTYYIVPMNGVQYKRGEVKMEIADSITLLVIVMGVLVFMVNVIVQVTKGLVPIKTDYYVLVVSIVLSVLSYLVYASYMGSAFIWYYVVASIIMGFFVCFIAQYGWEKFISLWEQSKKGK